MHYIVLEEAEKEKGAETILKEIIRENFPNLEKELNIQIQVA